MPHFGMAKVELFFRKLNLRTENLEFVFLVGGSIAFHEPFGPETVFVQNGDYRIAQVAAVAEIDASIERGGVSLPDRAVLAAVVKLNEERACFQAILLRIVLNIIV